MEVLAYYFGASVIFLVILYAMEKVYLWYLDKRDGR